MNNTISRRHFLKASGITISVIVANQIVQLSPSQAYAKEAIIRVLSEAQTTTLEVFAEALVPGSRVAGISHFIDSQLAGPNEDSLLMLKYLGVPQPHAGFYQAILDALAASVKTYFDKPISELNSKQMEVLIGLINQDALEDWAGPSASFAYFVLRSDAVDVVYGVDQGFADIGVPPMHHIKPKQVW